MSTRTGILKRLPSFPRDVWLITMASALGASSFLGMRGVLTTLYVLRLGFGVDAVGSISATGALFFCLASLPAGALGARIGAKRTMILGFFVAILSIAALPLTEVLPAPFGRLWPAMTQGLAASGWSLFQVNNVAMLAALTRSSNRAGVYSLREVMSGTGSFLGALFSGILPGIVAVWTGTTMEMAAPYRHTNWVCAGLMALALIPLAFVSSVGPTPRSVARDRVPFRITLPLALVTACAFCGNACFASCKAFASAYFDQVFHLSASLIGTLTSVGLLLSIVAALVGAQLARRISSGRAMIVAGLSLAVSVLIMALWPNWIAGAVGVVGAFGAMGMWRPSFQALQMEVALPEWRAIVSGVGAMSMSMGFSMVSFSGGYIADNHGYAPLFFLGSALALTSTAFACAVVRGQRMAKIAKSDGQCREALDLA